MLMLVVFLMQPLDLNVWKYKGHSRTCNRNGKLLTLKCRTQGNSLACLVTRAASSLKEVRGRSTEGHNKVVAWMTQVGSTIF